MPAVATAPQTDAEKAAEKAAEEAWADLVKEATSGDSAGARQVERAIKLEAEIARVRKSVDSNRKYLRLMDENDELTEAQSEFLDTFYPEKEKGERRSAEDIEATRKARESARKSAK